MLTKSRTQMIFSLVSLVVTLSLLILLADEINTLTQGDQSATRILSIIGLSLCVLVVSFLFSIQRLPKKKNDLKSDKKDHFQIRGVNRVKLESYYTPRGGFRCPFCQYENTLNARICVNCGQKLH